MTGDGNYRHADTLWATLQGLGLRDVCISPGSRSAPLTLSAAARENLDCHVALDERSGGFFALGLAKAGHRPPALVCTSGTAAVNYAPAVWEAGLSDTALLIITADRPAELQHCGAPQTLAQDRVFGDAVRASFTLPPPDDGGQFDVYASVAARAWAVAVAEQGPVHVNVPLREPLYPESASLRPVESRPREVMGFEPVHHPAAEQRLLRLLHAAARPLIVCGPMDAPAADRAALSAWSKAAGIPVLADIGSSLRFGEAGHDLICTYDLALRCSALPPPDLVVHLGGLPTSKTLNKWLQTSGARHVRLTSGVRWKDPGHLADSVLALPLSAFRALPPPHGNEDARAYATLWRDADQRCRGALERLFAEHGDVYEALYFGLGDRLTEPATIFLSNSLSIRDADTFWPASHLPHHCYVNRGANGIDGIVSTAAGCAVAEDRPLLLLAGDLAFLHDNNGLQLIQSAGIRGAALVFNNDGGGLFSHIAKPPQAGDFERFFTTPHGLQFGGLAEMYGFRYVRTRDPEQAGHALAAAMQGGPFAIIELTVALADSLGQRALLVERLQELTGAAL